VPLLEGALEHHRAGRLPIAARGYKRVLEIEPDEPTALHFLGLIAYQEGRYPEALTCLEKVIALAPSYAEAHQNLGNLYLDGKKHVEALACYDRALAIRPDYPNALANKGDCLRGLGRLDEAATALRRSIQLDPFAKEARYRLAATLLSLDQRAEALEAAEGCLAIAPDCQNGWAYLATALLGLERKKEAERFHDLSSIVQIARLEKPNGFGTMDDFNQALEEAVRTHPTLVWEPFQRVSYGGSVTADLMVGPNRVLRQFEGALRQAIDRVRDAMPDDPSHPYYARKPRQYRLTLIASILKEGGWHPTHTHEGAWLSGCYYVRIPSVVAESSNGDAGCIAFGKPDCSLAEGFPLLSRVVRPEPGMAVFFPSYLFHGTVPFGGDEQRIGIAFDAYSAD
jgi:tetratricopeptide (TPR) repeat protein